jgi:hypothetical protein
MELEEEAKSFICGTYEPFSSSGNSLRSLVFTTADGGTKLLGVQEEGHIREIFPGFFCDRIASLETPTKAVAVFSPVHFPSICLVSTIGSTTILENRGGELVELDQNQTRFGLSDMTIYVGDCMRNVAVQATKTWVNLVSVSGNAVYRPPNGERVLSCSSRSGLNRIALGLGEGDLRGKGRVILLEVSPDGQIKEITRKDILQEVLDVTIVDDQTILAITNDNSVHHFLYTEGALKAKTHLRLNIPLKSVRSFMTGEVIVSSASGVVVQLRVDTNSGELGVVSYSSLTSDILALSDATKIDGKDIIIGTSSSKCFLLTPDGEVIRLFTGRSVSSVAIGSGHVFSVVAGDLLVSSRPDFGQFVSKVFSTSSIVSIPSTVTGVVQPDKKRDVLLLSVQDESPILMKANPREGLSLFSIDPANLAVPVGKSSAIVSGSNYLALIELLESDSVRIVWTVPFYNTVTSLCQVNEDQIALTTQSGDIEIYTLSWDQVPRRIALTRLGREESSDLHIMSPGNGRILLMEKSSGRVTSCFLRSSDHQIIFTSVAPESWEPISLSSFCLLGTDIVVLGSHDGRIRIVQLPFSVDSDEQSGIPLLATPAGPEMCMCVNELVDELNPSSVAISSVVTRGPVAYFSTEDGRFGVLRMTSRSSWTWI